MKKSVLIIFFSVVFTGCDQFTWFQSEGSVRKKLQGTWEKIFPGDADYDETWIFNNGTLTILQQTLPNPVDTADQGTYEVNNSIFSAHVRISGLTDTTHYDVFDNLRPFDYNKNWTIIDLDDRILYMVADLQAGLVQREFVKKD